MFSDGSQFSDMVDSAVVLQTADKRNHKIAHEGICTLHGIASDGTSKRFHIGRTLHTPSMHNLLSCCGVIDQGGVVHLEDNNSYIKLKDNTIFPVRKKGRLFYLDYVAKSPISKPTNMQAQSNLSHVDSCSAGWLPREAFNEAPPNPVSACTKTDAVTVPVDSSPVSESIRPSALVSLDVPKFTPKLLDIFARLDASPDVSSWAPPVDAKHARRRMQTFRKRHRIRRSAMASSSDRIAR